MKKPLINQFIIIKSILVISLIFIDFLTKQLVFHYLDLNQSIFINNFFEIIHIHNKGISFGLFSDLFSPWLLVCISSIILLMILFMYFKSNSSLEKIGLQLIIVGALSNIFDRIYNGFVIDFIFFHINNFNWPAFNFADIYISIGIFILILQIFNDLIRKVINK